MALPNDLHTKAGVAVIRRWPGGNDANGVYRGEEQWVIDWSAGVGHILDSPPWPGVWEYSLETVAGANYATPNADIRFVSVTISGKSHMVAQVIKK